MDRKILIALLSIICVLIPSCVKPADAEVTGCVVLTDPVDGHVCFDTLASVRTLSFTASADWKVKPVNSSAGEWCIVTPEGGAPGDHTLEISVSQNLSYQKRSAAFNVVSGDVQQKVLVTQDAAKKPAELPAPESIRILAIGNSFSDDSMWYLYDLLKQAGYDQVKLANLYIGSCTLQNHAYNINSGAQVYTYRVNDAGKWIDHESFSSADAVASDSWDIITLQQASGSSGLQDTYQPHVDTIVSKVKELCPGAELVWHMTWAYQEDSTHPEFYKYGHDQMAMYDSIVSAVKENILADEDFVMVISTGTAIQNLRTGIYGDTVTRDGFHLAYDSGRLAAAMMWLKSLTGCDLGPIIWTPSAYAYTPVQIASIKEAVDNAYKNPFHVTPSEIKGE